MKNHFLYFTKAERFGIISLLLICLGLWIVPACIPDRQTDQSTAGKVLPDLEQMEHLNSEDALANDSAQSVAVELKPFSPNAVTASELLAMGLSESTVRAWQSYLQKGGRFTSWDDLQKFRALKEADRKRLRPYLRFKQAIATMAKQPQRDPLAKLNPFDPNEQHQESLLALGLSQRVARNWVNYLEAGGRFRQAADIQKVYGLTPADFERLLPFVEILDSKAEWAATEAVPEVALPSSYDKADRQFVVDINQASAKEWQRLRGIGPAYSRRIVKFRDKLGGFHSVEQVKETYGLPDSVYQAILLQLRPSPIFKQLSINQATVEDLAAHPYLYYQDARAIVRYREEHGPFQSTTDLAQLYALEPQTLNKMAPYWDFTQ
ncbi:MAG: helix-hairpin-helix domain-containing protein [Bacteroidota bacterium]